MTPHLGWPQVIFLTLLFLNVATHASKNGQPRSDHDLGAAMIGGAITVALVWWGGFFG